LQPDAPAANENGGLRRRFQNYKYCVLRLAAAYRPEASQTRAQQKYSCWFGNITHRRESRIKPLHDDHAVFAAEGGKQKIPGKRIEYAARKRVRLSHGHGGRTWSP